MDVLASVDLTVFAQNILAPIQNQIQDKAVIMHHA